MTIQDSPRAAPAMTAVPPPAARHDLESLEFHVVRELLTAKLMTPLGGSGIAALAPLPSAEDVRREGRFVLELATRLVAGDEPPLRGIVEVRSWLQGFFAGEHLPESRELADLTRALRAAQRCREWLAKPPESAALGEESRSLPDLVDLVAELDLILDARGEVLSTASVKLGEIRSEIARRTSELEAAIHRFLASGEHRQHLAAPEPTWRHGRPVFAVRFEHRHAVPGIIHDRSQTGATVFIEPETVVAEANSLADARAAEHREILVILANVCHGLLGCRTDIERALQALVRLDCAQARARLIGEEGHVLAELSADDTIVLSGALHPTLLRKRERRSELVPLDLSFGGACRLLVITGPNTGGKTVVLKTVGLLGAMAMCAVPIPARPGSRYPFLDGIFADIGDQQAIATDLSTFASHLQRILRAIAGAGSRSLVLIDELGSGTDPEEGGALGTSLLEECARRQALVCVTTHLGKLKEYANQHPDAQNACMSFDPESLQPTYRLLVGTAGTSHALDIARRLGADAALVGRARALLAERDPSLVEAIQRVESVRTAAEHEHRKAAQKSVEVEKTEQQLRARLAELERRQVWIEEEASDLVDQELRRLRGPVADALRQLQSAASPLGLLAKETLDRLPPLLRATSLHRRRMEFLGNLRRDDAVFVPALGKKCVVKRIDWNRESILVTVGKIDVSVRFEEVSWLQPLQA